MAERLCGGRVVSVVERHCVAAQADTNADPGGAPPPATTAAAGVGGGPEKEGGPRNDAGREDGSDAMETSGNGGSCEDGAGDGATPPPGEKSRHEKGGRQKGEGAPHDDDGGPSSELECLQGHIRGLRVGCVGLRASGAREGGTV